VDAWLRMAAEAGVKGVDVFAPFLEHAGLGTAGHVKGILGHLGLTAATVVCESDLAHPNAHMRQQAMAEVERAIQNAATLGAQNVQCTAGEEHPGTDPSLQLRMVADELMRLAEYGRAVGVTVALQNRGSFPVYENSVDMTRTSDVFLRLCELVHESRVRIALNCGGYSVDGAGALDILSAVGDRVVAVCAGDRDGRTGEYVPLGEGVVDYDAILGFLAARGFRGWIGIEDGQRSGEAGFGRSLAFLRSAVARHWGMEAKDLAR